MSQRLTPTCARWCYKQANLNVKKTMVKIRMPNDMLSTFLVHDTIDTYVWASCLFRSGRDDDAEGGKGPHKL